LFHSARRATPRFFIAEFGLTIRSPSLLAVLRSRPEEHAKPLPSAATKDRNSELFEPSVGGYRKSQAKCPLEFERFWDVSALAHQNVTTCYASQRWYRGDRRASRPPCRVELLFLNPVARIGAIAGAGCLLTAVGSNTAAARLTALRVPLLAGGGAFRALKIIRRSRRRPLR
jgi:hypothetical protein